MRTDIILFPDSSLSRRDHTIPRSVGYVSFPFRLHFANQSLQEVTLKRLPDMMMATATIGLFCLNFYTRFAFCQSDGTVEFRDRYSMEVLSADMNSNTVTSLVQAGFSFTAPEPGKPPNLVVCIGLTDGRFTHGFVPECLYSGHGAA